MEIMEFWRAAFVDAIATGRHQPADLVLVPDEDAEVRVTLHRLADNLEQDQAPVPPAAREALRLPEGARFADAVQVLRTRWEEDTASKPESEALEQARRELTKLMRDVKNLKPRLKVAAGRLAAAAATAVPVEIADDGTKYTVERWVSEALTSTLVGSVSEALDDVVARLAYLQDFDAVRQDIHDFR